MMKIRLTSLLSLALAFVLVAAGPASAATLINVNHSRPVETHPHPPKSDDEKAAPQVPDISDDDAGAAHENDRDEDNSKTAPREPKEDHR